MKKIIMILGLLILLSSFVSAVVTDGIIARNSMNVDGSDETANNYDYDILSTVTHVTTGCKEGGCYSFTDHAAPMSYMALTNPYPTFTNYTIAHWFYINGTGHQIMPLEFGHNNKIEFIIAVGGVGKVYQMDATGAWGAGVSVGNVIPNQWHQIIISWNGAAYDMNVYMDGLLKGSNTRASMKVYGQQDVLGNEDIVNKRFGSYMTDDLVVWNRQLNLITEMPDILNKTYAEFAGAPAGSLTTTLVYPINTTHYSYYNTDSTKNYNGSIVVTTNLDANCTPNNNTWSIQSTGGKAHHFLNATPSVSITPGNYTMIVTCNNVVNTTNTSFWFIIDDVNATINVYEPINNTLYYDNFYLNVSYFDTYLYRTNTTITRDSDSILVYNNYSGDLSGVDIYYNITELINITNGNYTNGGYTLLLEATDTHTKNKYFENVNVKSIRTKDKDKNQIEYTFKNHKVKIKTPDKVIVNNKQKSDRLTLSFTAETLGETYKIIEAENSMIYLPNSPFKGHFILDDSLWYDCEGLDVTKIEKITDKEYKVYYNQNKLIEESHSLGGLNYINRTVYFMIGHTDINITVYDSTSLDVIMQNISLDLTFSGFATDSYTAVNGTIRINDTRNGNLTIEAITTGYNDVTITDVITPGLLNNITLYMTNSSLTGATIMQVIDSNSQPVDGATIKIYKLIAGNWTLDTELNTNFEGETVYQFIRDIQKYKFQVWVDSVMIQETGSTLIFKSILVIQISLTTDELLSVKYLLPSTSTLIMTNVSNLITYTYSWAGGTLKGARLITTKRILTSNNIIIAENISNQSFGSMTVKFTQQPGILYTTEGLLDTNTTGSWYSDKQHDLQSSDAVRIFGASGLMAAFLLVGVLSFLFIKTHPAAAIVMNIIALFGASIFGFIAGITYSWVILVGGVGILILFLQKT